MSDQQADVFHDYSPMQIRSVPLEIRKFYNELARSQDCTLGELLIRIAQGRVAVPTTVGGRANLPTRQAEPERMAVLLQAAQALELVQRASGQHIPARTAASLTRAIAAEVRLMRGLQGSNRPPLLESPTSA